MSFHSIPPQESYFYEGSWEEDSVELFIHLLVEDKKKGNWHMKMENYHYIENAKDFINVMMEHEYTWDDALALRDMLKKRYETFNNVLNMDGVWWDRNVNHVYAPNWDEIFKVNEFVKSLYHKGDIMYDKLCALFGSDEVISISSDGPIVAPTNNLNAPIFIKDSDDEVESPLPRKTKIGCKKNLFGTDSGGNIVQALEALESKKATNYCTVVNKKDKMPMFDYKRALVPFRPKGATKNEASSCTQSSPTKDSFSPV